MATGGLRFWKDGRDVPDVMLGLFDYPEGFNLSLRVNFVDGGEESEGLIFTGSEGTMEIGGNAVSVSRVPREKDPGYTIDTFTEAMQKQILAEYQQKYPEQHPVGPPTAAYERVCGAAGIQRQLRSLQELLRFGAFAAAVVEDAVFGYRAAGAACSSNVSMEKGTVVHWDPEAMKIV